MRNPRVVIVQPYIPDYRVPLFTGLGQALAQHNISLQVAAAFSNSGRHDDTRLPRAIGLRDRLAFLGNRLRYRDLSALQIGPDDHVIVEDAMKNLETWPLLLKRGQPPLALWGHGTASAHGRSFAPGLKAWFRGHADWYFAYTPTAAESLLATGFPQDRVTTLHNTLDTNALRADLRSLAPEALHAFRASHHLTPGHTALFLGSLDNSKDPAFLERVIDVAQDQDPLFRLLVGGRGSAEDSILRKPAVVPLGRVTGPAKAMALASSEALVMPQGIGLVAVDSLVSGVPIVTRRNSRHGPEASYLTPGADSLWLAADCTPQAYTAALLGLLADAERRQQLGDACLLASRAFDLDPLVHKFVSGIQQWMSASRRTW